MERKLRIGIIGTGGIAYSHMRSYLQMDDVEIVGASDIVPGKARAFLDEFELNDVPAFENNADLLKLELDGVSVCTYNTTHHICACEAMEAGVNVLCEKPMSVTLEQAVEMARTQKKTGKILTIGFQPRYGANMRMVKELVRSGELGRVYYVQTGGGRRRGIPGGTFVDKKLAGVGCLADIGCYALDMALNTVGYKRPVTVSAYSSDFFGKNPKYYNKGPFDVDDFSCALVRFEDDMVLDFRMSWAMHMDTMGDMLFLGTDAGLKVKSPNPHLNWGGAWDGGIGEVYMYRDIGDNQVEIHIPKKMEDDKKGFFFLKCRDFCNAILNNGPSPIPWQEIIYNQAIIDGIIRSSAAKSEVRVEIPEI
ncbi:MAG TPA: Gfo/Idh/MocA family oxidoreductase [Candidatus Alectryocaccomicrobium excrementavium]|uniref:Gfo/Idh/MocA family oxidoreductase n=1 Tax=Candidatus Alectryocaccomicrobium excrementavium TaxID=2840668 RepID=A0A9D1FZB9_9FIRM|nr:Gfo/Idh/MocA family oxidoreductase [Candidatus Alectryocaccomicrobium excrementavium]